jgi:hypothetical protein
VSVKNLVDDDEDGDNDDDDSGGDSVTLDDIRKQMFETENVVIDKNTDHGLSRLSENQGDKYGQEGVEDSFYSMN